MSVSHEEAWERRKSYLIRCLFNDVPYRVLSPISEESTRSFTTSPRDGATSSSSVPPPRSTTSTICDVSAPRRVAPSVDGDRRAHSPLPPLIVERVPNKHDDPPEYYRTLLTKMRIIYKKMFIENVDISYDDDFYSDHEQYSIVSIRNRESSCTSDVNISRGYSGDLDSTNSITNKYDCNVNDDELQLENGGDLFKMIEAESELLGGREINISCCDLNDQVMADVSTVLEEEAHYRQITTEAQIHADGTPRPRALPSPEYGHNTQAETIDTRVCDDTRHTHTSQETLSTNEHIDEAQVLNSSRESLSQVPECQSTEDVQVTARSVGEERGRELSVGENGDQGESVEVEDCEEEPAECEMFEDQATNDTQLTRAPLTPERSAGDGAALVLRYRRTGDGTLVGEAERESAGRETHADLATSSSTSEHELEVMRAHRPERSGGHSLAPDITRQSTDMYLTCEHNTIQQDISSVTSHSQDGRHERAAETNSSRSIDNILSTIFNESLNKNREATARGVTSRKRSYKDISIQTERCVKWNDLRANLLVGRAKILKLCSCVGHICS